MLFVLTRLGFRSLAYSVILARYLGILPVLNGVLGLGSDEQTNNGYDSHNNSRYPVPIFEHDRSFLYSTPASSIDLMIKKNRDVF